MFEVPELIAERYAKNKYPQPDHDQNPKLKDDPKFYKEVAEAMLSDYFNNQGIFPYQIEYEGQYVTFSRFVDEVRAYARGHISPAKYFPYFQASGMVDKSTGDAISRESYMNISWAPSRITSKFVRTLKGLSQQIDFRANVQASDPESLIDKDTEAKFWKIVNSQQIKELNAFMKEARVDTKEVPQLADSDIDSLHESGGIKMGYEIAMNEAVNQILIDSKFRNIKDKLFEDLITLNKAICEEYYESGQVNVHYWAPEQFIGRNSVYEDGRNMDIGGVIRGMTLLELRRETNIEEKVLWEMFKKYATRAGYKTKLTSQGAYTTSWWNDVMNGNYNDMILPVFDFKFISSDLDKYTSVKRKDSNNLVYRKVDFDYKLSKKDVEDGKIIEEKRKEYVYSAKFILGTDVVFDYGREDTVRYGRPGYKRAILPYHVFFGKDVSLVETMIPLEDDINIAIFKKRDAIATLPPSPGIALDLAAVQNVVVNGVKMSFYDLLNIYQQRGVFLVDSTDERGEPTLGATSTPIKPLRDKEGFYNDIQAFQATIEYNIGLMRQLTGVTDITEGGAEDPRIGLGVAKLRRNASITSVSPVFNGYKIIFEQLSNSLIYRIQGLASKKEVEVILTGQGQTNIKTILLGKEVVGKQFTVFTEVVATDEQKDRLLARLDELAMANVQNSTMGVTIADAMIIGRVIESGNIDKAMYLLSKAVERVRAMAKEDAREATMNTMQVQIESARSAEEEKRKTIMMETEAKLRLLAAEGQIKSGHIIEEGKVDSILEKVKGEQRRMDNQQKV